MISLLKFSKGQNYVKTVGRVISALDLIVFYICTRFHENISKAFRAVEQTQFPYKNFKRGIILS